MSERPAWRRRQLLVRPVFQLRFIGMYVLQTALVLAVLALLVRQQLSRLQQAATQAATGADVTSRLLPTFEATLRNFYTWSLLMLALALVLLVVFGLFASHRLAGPSYKLTRHFDALAAGDDMRRIAFRRKDRLDEFAAHLNSAVDAMAQHRRAVSESLAVLASSLGELREAEAPADARRILDDMEEVLTSLSARTEVEGQP